MNESDKTISIVPHQDEGWIARQEGGLSAWGVTEEDALATLLRMKRARGGIVVPFPKPSASTERPA